MRLPELTRIASWPSRGRKPEHRSIIVIDTAGSGRWDNFTQLRSRSALRAMVRAALRTAGIGWRSVVTEDRGDGMIVLIPPTVSKLDIFETVIPNLLAGLHGYNAAVGATLRIRLRMAVHAGEVLRDRAGWTGADLYLACRLTDSAPVYQELQRCDQADLALVVSDVIHNSVVQQGYPGIDSTGYAPVHVVHKEIDTRAWLHVPYLTSRTTQRSRTTRATVRALSSSLLSRLWR